MAKTRSGLAGETAIDDLPMSLGSPLVRRVQLSPPSIDFQRPEPGPPERTLHGSRWWSQLEV